MADAGQLYNGMIGVCTKHIPGFEIRFKDEHFLQRLISILIFPFNRRYMTSYTSTFYPYVYFPSRQWVRNNRMRAFKVLAHEYVHLWDEKTHGSRQFKLSYLLPQLLAVFSLLAFFAFLWKPAIWALAFLVFALPLPSTTRRDIERRGYLMSFALNFWRYDNVLQYQIDHTVRQFVRSSYYFMWPFKDSVVEMLWDDIETLRDSSVFVNRHGEPFVHVHELLIEQKVIAA